MATLEQLTKDSYERPIIIFKHSTRCSISAMALNRLERAWNGEEMQEAEAYFLDLIRHRDVSQQVAKSFGVAHQSPQLLLIHQGTCRYDASHLGISYQTLKSELATG